MSNYYVPDHIRCVEYSGEQSGYWLCPVACMQFTFWVEKQEGWATDRRISAFIMWLSGDTVTWRETEQRKRGPCSCHYCYLSSHTCYFLISEEAWKPGIGWSQPVLPNGCSVQVASEPQQRALFFLLPWLAKWR